MAVIPKSQLVLMRKQREFEHLLAARDWQGLIDLEGELVDLLDAAISDPERSTKDLLKQMGQITRLYRDLSAACHLEQKQHVE